MSYPGVYILLALLHTCDVAQIMYFLVLKATVQIRLDFHFISSARRTGLIYHTVQYVIRSCPALITLPTVIVFTFFHLLC